MCFFIWISVILQTFEIFEIGKSNYLFRISPLDGSCLDFAWFLTHRDPYKGDLIGHKCKQNKTLESAPPVGQSLH